jgi:hypothetical protein
MGFNGYYDNFSSYSSLKGNLGDYSHAAKMYRANNMLLAPKVKFLFHIVININSSIKTPGLDRSEINLLAKSVDLPKYKTQTETLNQYNRKKVLHTTVQYQPLSIEFHDDNKGATTKLWNSYFNYYYQDSRYSTSSGSSPSISESAYSRTVSGLNTAYGSPDIQKFRYGLDTQGKVYNFFTSIQIFQLHPKNIVPTFTSFTLINPLIDSFDHDNMDYSQSELVSNKLSLSFESVQYAQGPVLLGVSPTGFGEPAHYDLGKSSLNNPFANTNFNSGISNVKKTNSAVTLSTIENLSKPATVATTQTVVTTNQLGNIEFPTQGSVSNTTVASQRNF